MPAVASISLKEFAQTNDFEKVSENLLLNQKISSSIRGQLFVLSLLSFQTI
jgi:hypothetical protein